MDIVILAVGIVILLFMFIFAFLIVRRLSSITARLDKQVIRKQDLKGLDGFLERYDRDINFLTTMLTRKSHSHNARYEHEFKILTEIWDSLISCRRAVSLIQPDVSQDSPTKPEEYRKAEILAAFATTYTEVFKEIEQNRPFYPAAVCEQLLGLIRLMEDEGLDDWGRSPDPHLRGYEPEYWEMGLESSDRIITAIDGICQSIRVRIMG
jgi:hypothetical protein